MPIVAWNRLQARWSDTTNHGDGGQEYQDTHGAGQNRNAIPAFWWNEGHSRTPSK